MNFDIIKAPVITEKSAHLADNNVYTFKVDKRANKTQIKQVIEAKFGVKVESVNTLNTKVKLKELEDTLVKQKLIRKRLLN